MKPRNSKPSTQAVRHLEFKPRVGEEPSNASLPSGDREKNHDHKELSHDFINAIKSAIEANDPAQLKKLANKLHGAEQADVLTIIAHDLRPGFITLLGDDFKFDALTEVDDAIRLQILKELPQITIAQGIRNLESNDAIYILEDLADGEQISILSQIPSIERLTIKRGLDYPEDSAGRLMHTEFIAVPPFWTVAATIAFIRNTKNLPDEFYEIFVIDPSFHFAGTVALDKLLRADSKLKIKEVMHVRKHMVNAAEDKEEIAYLFQRYDLVNVAVVDDNGRLLGGIAFDDIAEVIQEEAVEDMGALGGVRDEEVSNSVFETVKSRFNWLLINLGTAIIASIVISRFDTTIDKMVALAVLMPIVASMGGNAGTQTMTVAVRALAMRDINIFNLYSVIFREAMVGLINGILFSAIIGGIVIVWFRNVGLGLVISLAMVVNMVAAGVSGILIPMALNRLRIDPAVASSVFLTTITDVIGFFAFLSLAGWYFDIL